MVAIQNTFPNETMGISPASRRQKRLAGLIFFGGDRYDSAPPRTLSGCSTPRRGIFSAPLPATSIEEYGLRCFCRESVSRFS